MVISTEGMTRLEPAGMLAEKWLSLIQLPSRWKGPAE